VAEKLYPLQLVEFLDKDRKADDYSDALQGIYKGCAPGDEWQICCFGGGMFSVLLSAVLLAVGVASPFLAVASICGGAAVFSALMIGRTCKRGVRKVLDDPEARYYHLLRQAAEAYNKQAGIFNRRLLAGEENMDSDERQRMASNRYYMEFRHEFLQKRMIPEPADRLPKVDLSQVTDRVWEVREAEGHLALLAPRNLGEVGSSPERLALPESTEYREALAELEAEFPCDKD